MKAYETNSCDLVILNIQYKMAAPRRVTAMQALKKLMEHDSTDDQEDDGDSSYTPSEDFGDLYAGIN